MCETKEARHCFSRDLPWHAGSLPVWGCMRCGHTLPWKISFCEVACDLVRTCDRWFWNITCGFITSHNEGCKKNYIEYLATKAFFLLHQVHLVSYYTFDAYDWEITFKWSLDFQKLPLWHQKKKKSSENVNLGWMYCLRPFCSTANHS